MGSIVGSVIGGVGSLLGASAEDKASKRAAQTARLGFDYLRNSPLTQYGERGNQAGGAMSALLGLGGDQAASDNAFSQYLNSSGYRFQLGQGQDAITANNATRGLLNSGATLRATQEFGQNLASNYFQNYLNQLNTVSEAGRGAISSIGAAGSSAGNAAAGYVQAGGTAQAGGIAGAAEALGGIAGSNAFSNLFSGSKKG